MPLASNRELLQYMLGLSKKLESRGAEELSQMVNAASHHAAGMSTEFLGEAQITLRKLLEDGSGILSEKECSEVIDLLKQLTAAFDRR